MNYFNLPQSTNVHLVIPKNAFDSYTNTNQKKLFTSLISRIEWVHKLSQTTINLEPREISEIQVIKIDLKEKQDISKILQIIDKATPYHIIFVVAFEDSYYISASKKHPHPTNPDNSVIDWTFKTPWLDVHQFHAYTLNLRENLDVIFKEFCEQIQPITTKTKISSLSDLVSKTQEIDAIKSQISKLESKIKNTKQFNIKVELNEKLRNLKSLLNSNQ